MIILSDVNLDEISFFQNGKGVEFRFVDLENGSFISNIICDSMYLFNYHNTFLKDDGFACYIGEVTGSRIHRNEIGKWLNEMRFSFVNMDGSVYKPTENDLIHLHVEGGEVVIELACETVTKDGVQIII